jgi:aminoglycoside phosphotransferase (APT) family kinase protein
VIFRLGEKAVVRLPNSARHALQIEKEQRWLSQLAPQLSLPIPEPLALGKPGEGYPWPWMIYNWLEGNHALEAPIENLCVFAAQLAEFIRSLQAVDPRGGPVPGHHSLYRGGPLAIYDAAMRGALHLLKPKMDVQKISSLWGESIMTSWEKPPVWIHADISPTNLLVKGGQLSAVIDFGLMTIGDPAYELSMAWTFFDEASRAIFRKKLSYDEDTWRRGRALALYKAVTHAAGMKPDYNVNSFQCWQIIENILAEASS